MPAFASQTPDATPVWLVSGDNWEAVRSSIGTAATAFAERCGFKPKAGRMQLLPGEGGALAGVLFGVDGESARARDPLAPGKLATSLPEGVYRFANPPRDADLAALGFLLALYAYDRFKADPAPKPQLVAPDGVDKTRLERVAAAVGFGRDLVNTPANALGPDALEQEAVKLAEQFDASVSMVRGDELLAANFPLIHAVGRAAAEEPRIVDFSWGREDAAKVSLIGKGVTFDTGGLDIKPASGMELMKKDMGGAATALTLARLVMEEGLDLRLRVVIPIVENAISARAMRPGDVLKSRKGLLGRGRQHRRRGPAHPCRRARACRRGRAGADARFRNADRRCAGRARPRPAALLHRRRCACSLDRRSRGARPRSPVAHAAVAPLRRDDRGDGRRHLEFGLERRHGGFDHRRAVPQAVRREGPSRGRISTSTPGTRNRAPTGPWAARSRRRGGYSNF